MKIFELNTFCTGSTGRIALDVADYAAEHGAQTILGFGVGKVPPRAEAYALRIGGKIGRKWHAAVRKLLDGEGYASIHATRKLIAFLKQYHPDVVHLHNLHGCYLNLRLLFYYFQKSNVPVVWTLHDCWLFTGHCAYYDRVGCEKWKTECHHCPQKHEYPVCVGKDGSRRNFRLKRKLFTSLSNLTLVTPCQWLADQLRDSFLKQVPVRVIYNGVDTQRFQPTASDLKTRYELTGKHLVLAVASEWGERKGLQYLPEIAKRLGDAYQLAVIGIKTESPASLPESILIIPSTENTEELSAWYTAADCLVNPTLEDNMPMVNLEALACGTPVVTFHTGGCAEAITAECGAVVPKGDVAALTEAVLQIAPNKQRMVTACLAQAERFGSRHAAEAYWSLLEEVSR